MTVHSGGAGVSSILDRFAAALGSGGVPGSTLMGVGVGGGEGSPPWVPLAAAWWGRWSVMVGRACSFPAFFFFN